MFSTQLYVFNTIIIKARNTKITAGRIIIMKTLTLYRLVNTGNLTLSAELSIAKCRLHRLKYFPLLVPILQI